MLLLRNVPPMNYVREEFVNVYKERLGDPEPPPTVEIIGLQMLVDSPSLFGAPELDYIEREKKWYLSRSLSVKDIPGKTPKIWEQVAGEDGSINSNYGWMVYSQENHFQFQFCSNELKRNPMSRRAVIQFNRPSMVQDYHELGKNDYVCTYAYQFFIRNGYLHMLVYMRSLDMVYGFPNDLAWANYVMEDLLKFLNKPTERYKKGRIIWHAGSGHIYEPHFYLLDYFIETGRWDVNKKEAKKHVRTPID